jgi:Tfp pilus assembly protein PilF
VVEESGGINVAQLAAVRLTGDATSSRLLLEFSRPSGQSASVSLAEQRMTVRLPERMTPASVLPRLRIQNALVSSVDLLQVDQHWQIQVSFATEVRVEKMILEADAQYGERLAFDIFPLTEIPQETVQQNPPQIPVVAKKDIPEEIPVREKVVKQVLIVSPAEQAEDFYQRGLKAARGDQPQTAMTLWQKALRSQPEHILARKQLIRSLIPAHRNQADRLFSEGLNLHPPLELRKWYARALLPVFGAAQAAEILDVQQVSAAEDAEYKALQAGLWQQTGDYSRSRQGYFDLLQLFPDKGIYWFGLAVAHDQLAEPVNAVTAYRRALQRDLETELSNYSQLRIDALSQTRGAGN